MPQELEPFKVTAEKDVWTLLEELDKSRTKLDVEFIHLPEVHLHAPMAMLKKDDKSFQMSPKTPAEFALKAPTPARFSGTLKKARIQFDAVVTGITACGEISLLQIKTPRHVFRIQRRDTFRVHNCKSDPIVIGLKQASGADIEIPLHDISVGGCSFLIDLQTHPLQAETVLKACTLNIPGQGKFETDLQVKTMAAQKAENKGLHKTGCMFLNLQFKQEAAIQRYIIEVEHKQRMAS
ncbi:MAG: PilZ domain-containing protein [Burkholderiales bacterium]|nr:PilZ domain-containing protein [Burkholderiales bacterium]